MEHVKVVQALDNYVGDLSWVNNGVANSISCGDISMDGAGCT